MSSKFQAYLAKQQDTNPLAQAAAGLGVPVFSCLADKRPATDHGFKDASTDRAAITAMFNRPGAALIGMPTGAATGWIVIDVDVRDGAQGRAWLDANSQRLPQTRTIRTQSGGLHLYFIAPLELSVRNQQSKIAPGIDVRGDGGYVIVPPSTGYSVADDAAPAAIPEWLLTVLQPPVAEPAHAAALAVPRRASALSIGGGTAYGLKALDGECEAIRTAPFGQQEGTLNAAGLKIGALIAGGELQEGTALAELLAAGRSIPSQPGKTPWRSSEIEHKVRRAVQDGMRRPRAAPEPEPEPSHPAAGLLAKAHARVAQQVAKPLPVAPSLLDVGGALGMFIDYCEATAISSQPFLALACGIAGIGVLAGRRYRTRTDLRTNIYTVGIADSGAGKDHARKRFKAVMGAANLTAYMGGEDVASGAAMLTALHRHPAMLFQIDEFGDWLAGVLGKNASTHKRQIAERLKTLYSSANSFMVGTEYADQSKSGRVREDIHQPHACLYGTTTPGQFWSAIEGGSLHDGLLARFLIFVSPNSYPDERDPDAVPPPPALVEAFQAIAAGRPDHGNLGTLMSGATEPNPYLVDADPSAERAIKSLRQEQLAMQREAQGTYVTAIAARWAENAVKLALVRAVSRDPAEPVIRDHDVAWGRAVSRHCIDSLLQDAERHISENDFDRRCNRALEIIRKHGPISEHKMQDRHGWRYPPRDRTEALRDLVSRNRIAALPTEPGKAGRPTVRYVIVPGGEMDFRDE